MKYDIVDKFRELKRQHFELGIVGARLRWSQVAYHELYNWMIDNGFKVPEYGKSFRLLGYLHQLEK